jgi:hypothetical protein
VNERYEEHLPHVDTPKLDKVRSEVVLHVCNLNLFLFAFALLSGPDDDVVLLVVRNQLGKVDVLVLAREVPC